MPVSTPGPRGTITPSALEIRDGSFNTITSLILRLLSVILKIEGSLDVILTEIRSYNIILLHSDALLHDSGVNYSNSIPDLYIKGTNNGLAYRVSVRAGSGAILPRPLVLCLPAGSLSAV